jgi:N-methylhydantoinase B
MDVVRMCRMRIRVPDQWWGDYLATLGAARVGERELLALGREIGWERLEAYTREWFDYSERRMIDVIRAMPKGRVTRSSTHDPFPATPPDGVTIRVTVEVKPEGRADRGGSHRQSRLHGERPDLSEPARFRAPDRSASSTPSTTRCRRTRAASPHPRIICATIASSAGRAIRPRARSPPPISPTGSPTRSNARMAEMADGLGHGRDGAVIPPSSGVFPESTTAIRS